MNVKYLGFCAAFMALTAQPAAAASNDFCLTRDEVRSGLSAMAPILIEGFVKSCTPLLAADSNLLTLGPVMAEKYRSVANATDEDLMALFMKIGGVMGDMPPDLPLDMMKQDIWDDMAKDIKATECTIADRIVPDLEALPAANMIGLVDNIVRIIELEDRQKKAKRTKKPIAPSVFCEE